MRLRRFLIREPMAALKLVVGPGRGTTGSRQMLPAGRGRRREVVWHRSSSWWLDAPTHVSMAVLQATDVADPEFLQLFDPVTTLPTRLLFQDRCRVALARARRRTSHVGVVVITTTGAAPADDRVRDTALRRIAFGVITVLRGDDTVARVDDD